MSERIENTGVKRRKVALIETYFGVLTERATIANALRGLVVNSKIFIVLASKRAILLEHILVIARKLIHIQLKPFNRENCTAYLVKVAQNVEPELCDIIYEWTNGYPLAVNVMIQAIRNNKLDPRKEQDQKLLLSIITEQVINRGVLSTIMQRPDDLEWFQAMLSLFSVSRRCNLSIMQKMIERFSPQYRLNSGLAYMVLPRRINQATDVLHWDPSKAGFSIETSIRHIFLLKLKIEQPEKYKMIHSFLALTNRRLASEVTGCAGYLGHPF